MAKSTNSPARTGPSPALVKTRKELEKSKGSLAKLRKRVKEKGPAVARAAAVSVGSSGTALGYGYWRGRMDVKGKKMTIGKTGIPIPLVVAKPFEIGAAFLHFVGPWWGDMAGFIPRTVSNCEEYKYMYEKAVNKGVEP